MLHSQYTIKFSSFDAIKKGNSYIFFILIVYSLRADDYILSSK